MPIVHIVNSSFGYERMFLDCGWELTDTPDKADLIQFTGGSDVSPELYGEAKHPQTKSSITRDMKELAIFNAAKKAGTPMAGICRGAQFLHVMSGGRLWQHIHGHAIIGTHEAFDCGGKLLVDVTSTHHQAMRSGSGELLLQGEAHGSPECMEGGILVGYNQANINEVVYHEDSKCFCFQGHPEMAVAHKCRRYYFDMLSELFGLKRGE